MKKVFVSSPLGMLKIEIADGVVGKVEFGSKKSEMSDDRTEVARELGEYFAGKRKKLSVKIEAVGTEFQRSVWQEIAKIPFGATISYKELARRVGMPKGYRAVANACGKNPVPIIIPCHRVVASNGGLGGYSGGLWRKKWMLEMETKDSDS